MAGRKIFISYKYGDISVQRLSRTPSWRLTKVRDYVDEIQSLLDSSDHINKGEKDGEDLSHFKDETIASHLRDKIYDSSLTIVLLSPNMKDALESESDQWIPWEISYSLKETKRADRTSHMNALLGIVLPDASGSYSYMITENKCCSSGCTSYNLNNTFKIIKENTFNRKISNSYRCSENSNIHPWPFSYIHIVTWKKFISDIEGCINSALAICERANEFKITKM